MDFTSIQAAAQFLIYGGGSALVVGVALSAFGERWAWFQALAPAGKALVQKVGAAVVAVAVWGLMTYLPPAYIAWAAVPFGIVVVAVGGTMLNQASHAIRKLNQLEVEPAAPPTAGLVLVGGATAPAPAAPLSSSTLTATYTPG